MSPEVGQIWWLFNNDKNGRLIPALLFNVVQDGYYDNRLFTAIDLENGTTFYCTENRWLKLYHKGLIGNRIL